MSFKERLEKKRESDAKEHSFRSGTPHYKWGIEHFNAGAAPRDELIAVLGKAVKLNLQWPSHDGGCLRGLCRLCEAEKANDALIHFLEGEPKGEGEANG